MSLVIGLSLTSNSSVVYFVDQHIRRQMLAYGPGYSQLHISSDAKFLDQPDPVEADDAFKLHDTYGFPIDLTRIMAEERGMSVDIVGYEKLMEEAREKARAGGKPEQSAVYDLNPAAISQLQADHAKPTDDSAKFGRDPVEANIIAIWNGTNFEKSIDVSADHEVAIILDRTNFYSEMGGQVGDRGTLSPAPSPLAGEGDR